MRLPGVQNNEAGLFVKIAYFITRRKYGKVIDPVRIYAYRPRILRAAGGLFRASLGKTIVTPRLKGLVMHQTSRLIGCLF
jgi:hypothetical protein